jgi:hypothetical protein
MGVLWYKKKRTRVGQEKRENIYFLVIQSADKIKWKKISRDYKRKEKSLKIKFEKIKLG